MVFFGRGPALPARPAAPGVPALGVPAPGDVRARLDDGIGRAPRFAFNLRRLVSPMGPADDSRCCA
jgi:hypothetical protein